MKFFLIAASAVLCCVHAAPSNEKQSVSKLTNYKLVEAKISHEDAMKHLRNLEDDSKINIWNEGPNKNDVILFSVSPLHFADVERDLHENKLEMKVVEQDLQKLVDQERGGVVSTFSSQRALRDDRFETYDQIVESIEYYEEQPSLGNIAKFVVGQTHEGRDIVGIQINNDASNTKKPLIVMECGIHAREWISTATCNYIIHQLITKQIHYRDLLDRYEFRIIPSTNPDGYDYSMNYERLWRKNRQPFGRCYGVDLNRNWKAGPHCGVGTETNSCSDLYCGPAPFSSPETNAMKDYLTGIKDRVEYYVSLHAYGLMWMYPYSYTTKASADNKLQSELASAGARALSKVRGTQYAVGPIAKTIYSVTGSSIDWTYDSLGIKKSFILELQPSQTDPKSWGGRGFLFPQSNIREAANETFIGLSAMWLSDLN